MKSILIGLTLTFSILWLPAYTQSDTSDKLYCLEIAKARLLIADAIRLRYADSLLATQGARIEVLETQKEAIYESFTNLLNISEQKFQKQKEITSDFVRLSDSWRDQSEHYQKEDRKHRRQRNGLAAGLVVVIVLTLVN